MSRKDDHDKKDDFNVYRDVFHIWDEDCNGVIDENDYWIYTNRQNEIAKHEKERNDYYYYYAEDDDDMDFEDDDFTDDDLMDDDDDTIECEDEEYREEDGCRDEFDDISNDGNKLKLKIPVSVSFSLEHKKRSKPTDGVWRYYDDWKDWDFDQALIDNFPELEEDYAGNRDTSLVDIILETYEIDKDRAVSYLKWLWKTFTPDLFADEKETAWGTNSFNGRGKLIERLIIHNEKCDYLYNLLKTDIDFLNAGFIDCRHPKHDYSLVKDYMEFMLKHNDMDGLKTVYEYYLKGQKGNYSNNDLSKLWKRIIDIVYYSYYSDEEKVQILQSFVPFVSELGIRSETTLEYLTNCQKKCREDIEEDEEYEEEDDYDEDYDEDDECDDYAQAVTVRNIYSKATDLSQDSTIYDYCRVSFINFKNNGLYYFTNGIDVGVGDEVVVPFGGDNIEESAIVIAVGKCFANAFGFDIARIKNIIKKIDK